MVAIAAVGGSTHDSDLKRRKRIHKKLRMDKVRLELWNYLEKHPCIDCKESDPVVLEFDHVRGEKIKAVANAVCDGWSWNKVLTEIEKCDVRCANCHRRRTATQFNWYKPC